MTAVLQGPENSAQTVGGNGGEIVFCPSLVKCFGISSLSKLPCTPWQLHKYCICRQFKCRHPPTPTQPTLERVSKPRGSYLHLVADRGLSLIPYPTYYMREEKQNNSVLSRLSLLSKPCMSPLEHYQRRALTLSMSV